MSSPLRTARAAQADTDADADADGRVCGDRGSGLVAGVTLMFAFTFLGLVWLAHDVDRAVSNESAAQSIAFQAARAAAQSATISDLRRGELTVDPAAAHQAARAATDRLVASYGLRGSMTSCVVDPEGRRVTVEVSITDGGITVSGVGIVSTERTP